MARPFSPQRHFDLIGRVERKLVRVAREADGKMAEDLLKASKACATIVNYIKRKDYAGGAAYMKKFGKLLTEEELPTTFETLVNQAALAKAKKKAA